MKNRKYLLNEFEFSNHICTNATKNVIETLEMLLDKMEPLSNEKCLSQTLGSNFNNIEIKVEKNRDIVISGLENKSDLQKPFFEVPQRDKELNMNIFQNQKYDLLVEYITGDKQLFENMTLEKLLQTDKADNILTIYDIGIINDLTLLAWRKRI